MREVELGQGTSWRLIQGPNKRTKRKRWRVHCGYRKTHSSRHFCHIYISAPRTRRRRGRGDGQLKLRKRHVRRMTAEERVVDDMYAVEVIIHMPSSRSPLHLGAEKDRRGQIRTKREKQHLRYKGRRFPICLQDHSSLSGIPQQAPGESSGVYSRARASRRLSFPANVFAQNDDNVFRICSG